MKHTIEQQLLDSRPDERLGNMAFVQRTMQAVKAASTSETFGHLLRKTNVTLKERLIMKFKTLPAIAAVAVIITGIATLGGVAYAAARLAPTIVHIFSKETSHRGTTEYNVPSFAACAKDGSAYPVSKFELNKDAPHLSDNDVEKTLQAKCELTWVDTFVSNTWPTYGSHKEWQNGDDIFYTRPDVLGTLQSVSPTTVSIDAGDSHIINYTSPNNQQIIAYENGEKVPLSQVKPGMTVFTVVRVAETYYNPRTAESNSNPRPQGIVALLVMSLPIQYYGSMQRYLTPITPCMGNPGESCPGTPSIDVFPREGGEGATNHSYMQKPDGIGREISGNVIKLSPNSLTLKTRTGKEYTVTTPANDFTAYNTTYAPNYTDMDASLKIGSTVKILYTQAPNANPQVITPDEIQTIVLQIDSSNPKTGPTKQY